MLQLDEPVKGDWASKCLAALKELKISENSEEIRRKEKEIVFNLIEAQGRRKCPAVSEKEEKMQRK